MRNFNVSDWYWQIGSDVTRFYSSKTNTYVIASDSGYQAHVAAGNSVPVLANEADLADVLKRNGGVMLPWISGAPSFVQPAPGTYSKGQLIAYANAKQSALSASGTSVNVGTTDTPQMIHADTDPGSLALLSGAATVAGVNPSQTFHWVPANDQPITLTAAQITALFIAVSAFIQSTFSALASVIAAINSGTITALDQVDNPPSPPSMPWPASGA